jgi:hypothetical protein
MLFSVEYFHPKVLAEIEAWGPARDTASRHHAGTCAVVGSARAAISQAWSRPTMQCSR